MTVVLRAVVQLIAVNGPICRSVKLSCYEKQHDRWQHFHWVRSQKSKWDCEYPVESEVTADCPESVVPLDDGDSTGFRFIQILPKPRVEDEQENACKNHIAYTNAYERHCLRVIFRLLSILSRVFLKRRTEVGLPLF